MFEANKATFRFLRENKLVAIIMILALSLLFATSVFLHGLSRQTKIEEEIYEPYAKSTYIIAFNPSIKTNTDSLFGAIEDLETNIHELVIRGNSFLVNKTGGKQKIGITGFYRKVNTPVSIIRGTDKMNDGQVLLNAWDFSSVFDPSGTTIYDMSDTGHLVFEQGGQRTIAGVVYYPTAISFWGVIVEYNQFYELAQESTSIEISFQNSLSKQEEKTFVNLVNKYVTVLSFQYPENIQQSSSDEGKIQLLMYRSIISICMLFAMKLLSYLYILRKRELTIIRMLGARISDSIAYILSALFQIVFASTILGVVTVCVLRRFMQSIYVFQYMSANQIINDIVFFWGIALVIGIIQLVFTEGNTIESTEEGT